MYWLRVVWAVFTLTYAEVTVTYNLMFKHLKNLEYKSMGQVLNRKTGWYFQFCISKPGWHSRKTSNMQIIPIWGIPFFDAVQMQILDFSIFCKFVMDVFFCRFLMYTTDRKDPALYSWNTINQRVKDIYILHRQSIKLHRSLPCCWSTMWSDWDC